ncbi:phosphotransferase family protein [Actinomadura harenae]|uniref:Aminoglycoside phosphotransferase family protein n=1 Tax=Actinomadura harenae TaxID=2483351 RepID=A0A3M2MCI6_9ACTN|nr:aminoglycoside phosphotransferase family protein [Actinomadura harenae]RMI47211.1 aminoglycoside phosphotransferase family protein [Actinomadura harenae]
MTWLDLYHQARSRPGSAAAGYYNHNIRLEAESGPVIVRIPIHGADVMDLRLWREEDVLTAIAPFVRHAPRVLHVSPDPAFQIHGFLHGDVLNDVAPRGVPVPSHVPDDVVELFVQLTAVPREKLPAIPDDWPADGDSAAFARRLTVLTQWVHDTYKDDYAPLFDRFGIPEAPLTAMDGPWSRLTPRPSVCVHADVHRKNMIVDRDATEFLDWELALWGDPVYDLAVHLHKMSYRPDEEETLVGHWLKRMPSEHTRGWEHDLAAYRDHERVKSAIVDTVRYSQTFIADGPYPYPPPQMVDMMAAKLNAARRPWNLPSDVTASEISAAFTWWAETRPAS